MCRQIKEKEMGGEGALCGKECGWKKKVKEEGLCFGDDKKPLPDKGNVCALPIGTGEPSERCSLIDPEL